MSTAATTQSRFSDPIAMAAAVVVIIGGATVIGVAASHDSTAAPSAPTAPAQVNGYPGAGVGLGDFTRSDQGHTASLKGGHVMIGLP
jgi:hypothetical protein